MKKLLLAPGLALMLFIASCGGGGEETTETTASTEETTPEETAPPVWADIPGIENEEVTAMIELTGNDQMQFNDNLCKVEAGKEITLTLKNIGSLPAAAMSHNAVVLARGTDIQAFGQAAVAATETEHIPQDYKLDVIAHTKMLGPGESDEITFTLPEAGVYDFLCTFPGHFATMQGKIVAVAAE